MNNKRWICSFLLSALLLTSTACAAALPEENADSDSVSDTLTVSETAVYAAPAAPETEDGTAQDAEECRQDITGDFVILSEDGGGYTAEGNTYTISGGGEYTLSGVLQGHLVISAPGEKVTLRLNNCRIECEDAAAVTVLSAEKLTLTAESGTFNEFTDSRSAGTETDEETLTPENAPAAVYAVCDMEVKGHGALLIEGNFNNGLASTGKVSVKNLTMKITAENNALKGNDGVTVSSGEIILTARTGDGIKTQNSGTSAKGNQKGNITVEGGHVNIYAAGNGISAAYDVLLTGDGYLTVESGTGSGQNASGKGIKAENAVTVEEDITVVISSADDAVHAGNTVTVSGGTLTVKNAYEGLEACEVNISGGSTFIYATDDGVNASTDSGKTASVNVSGGYLEVATPSGDTDAIDSNGNYVQTGGFVLVKGGNSSGSVAGSVDVSGSITVNGGCIVACGGVCETPSGEANAYVSSGTALSAGDYTLRDGSGKEIVSFSLSGSYSGLWIACDALETGAELTLSCNGSSVLSWTQEEGTMGSAGYGNYGGFGGFGGQGGQGGFGNQGGHGGPGGFGGGRRG